MQVGVAQVGTMQVGVAQVGTMQVGTAQAVESIFSDDGFDVVAFEDALRCGDFHWLSFCLLALCAPSRMSPLGLMWRPSSISTVSLPPRSICLLSATSRD